MTDVADQLYGIIDDLAGLEDGLELGGLVLVYEILVEIKPCGGEEWTGVIVQVGGESLPFFFLQFDAGIEHHFLLFDFHLLHLLLKFLHFSLMEDDEHYKPDGEHKHSYRT